MKLARRGVIGVEGVKGDSEAAACGTKEGGDVIVE